MITKLDFKDIIEILKKTPEQALFDWKKDFTFNNSEDEKAEFIKDISAVANGTINSGGYLFYGVNPKAADAIVGMTSNDVDDATLQQFVKGKIEPPITFLKYEVMHSGKKVVIVHVPMSRKRPHIISCDIGKLRQGQILIRVGSSTRGIQRNDLLECFYGNSSPYFPNVRAYILNQVNGLKAINETQRISQDDEDRTNRDINRTLGFDLF